MNQEQKSSQHERILIQIDKIREVHDACTAESVARDLKLPVQNVKLMCGQLRDAGLVYWTTMPGSLRTIRPIADELADARAELAATPAVEECTEHGDAEPQSSTGAASTDQPSKRAAPKAKKRAAKKAASSS